MISRESSCFVGAILAVLASFIPRFGVVDVWTEIELWLSVFVAGSGQVSSAGLLGLTKIAGLLLFNGDEIVAPE